MSSILSIENQANDNADFGGYFGAWGNGVK